MVVSFEVFSSTNQPGGELELALVLRRVLTDGDFTFGANGKETERNHGESK
jgi:hypothetical protein